MKPSRYRKILTTSIDALVQKFSGTHTSGPTAVAGTITVNVGHGLSATITDGILTVSGTGILNSPQFRQALRQAPRGVIIAGAEEGSHISLPENSAWLFL